MNEPYVVSEDIYLLLRHWAGQRGFILPSDIFFRQIRDQFKDFFKNIFFDFEMISEQEMVIGIKMIIDKNGLTPVSLDRSYFLSRHNFDITRFVDKNKNDVGMMERYGAPNIHDQLQKLGRDLAGEEVVVVDDVIFFGDAIEKTIGELSKSGIKVSAICAGIGIEGGVERLRNSGYRVDCVRSYKSVIDEVCERDFYPGVPLSGRSVVGRGNIGAPYILPFGDPGKWASIPVGWQKSLSKFCIRQTIKLFEAIEEESKRIVACSDLDRMVIGFPTDNKRFVECLKEAGKNI